MKPLYRLQALSFICMFLLLSLSFDAYSQKKKEVEAKPVNEKDITKADAILKKAVEEKNGQSKQEGIQKALELFDKGGMDKKESAVHVADALLEVKDYNGATSYYGRANKEDKLEGYKKIGASYIEDAPNDAKNEAKLLKKALDNYTKGGAAKEGYAKIGDYYYAKGPESLQLALDNYELGTAVEQLNKIAGDFYDKGPEFYPKAASAYEKTGSPEGLKKAGDIYWGIKDYEKAYAAYDKGNNMDGIKKYADRLYETGNKDAANAQYNKIADYYVKNKNVEGVKRLASNAFDKADYELAAMYYEKMSDTKMAEKSHAYEALFKLDFDGASKYLESSDEQDLAKAIKANSKNLTALPGIAQEFDMIKQNEPYVGTDSNGVGEKVPNAKDQANFVAYYKSYLATVPDKVFLISTTYAKVTDPTLKKIIKQKFMTYGAVRRLLNPETLAKKKEKAMVKVDDLFMQ